MKMKLKTKLQEFIVEHESELGTARRDADVMVQVRKFQTKTEKKQM